MKSIALSALALILLAGCEQSATTPAAAPEPTAPAEEITPAPDEVQEAEQPAEPVEAEPAPPAETEEAEPPAEPAPAQEAAEQGPEDVPPAVAEAPETEQAEEAAQPDVEVGETTIVVPVAEATDLVGAKVYTFGWASKEEPLLMTEEGTEWSATFIVTVSSGVYELAVDQATRGTQRPFDVTVNDEWLIEDIGADFVTKGGAAVSTEVFPIGTVQLVEGENTVTLSQEGNASPHISALHVTPVE
jgi:hypothetical protein